MEHVWNNWLVVSFFQSISNASDGISSRDPTLTCEMGKCRAKSCANGCHLRASSQCPCRLFHSCLFPFIFPFRRPEALDRHRSPDRNNLSWPTPILLFFPFPPSESESSLSESKSAPNVLLLFPLSNLLLLFPLPPLPCRREV